MKINKFIYITLSAAILLGTVFVCTSCTKTENSSGETIRVMLPGTEPSGWEEVLAEYEKRTKDTINVKLDVEWVPSMDMKNKLNMRMTAGEDYDLVFDSPFYSLKQFASSGIYMPLEGDISGGKYPNLKAAY